MKISQTNNNYTNFKAKLISKIESNVGNNCHKFELYNLDKSDKDFAKKMAKKIDLKRLYPNLESYNGFQEWKNLINNATERIDNHFTSVLAVHNKRPCGIMIYQKDEDGLYLNYLARWKTSPEEELPNVGKILMHHLFKVADKEQLYSITLRPAECKPRAKSCKQFYKDLGFKEQPNCEYKMENTSFFLKCAQLENFFQYEEVKHSKNQKAQKLFNLNYYGTFCDKFARLLSNLYKKLGI